METSAERPKGLFQCTECKRSYTRVDHLARHVRSHLQEKPFQCDVCHKGFGRPDLLKRHATCHDTDANGAKRQKRTLVQSSRVSQACKSCAYAKLKCEDEKPCKRCRNKGIECESNSDHRANAASSQPSVPSPPQPQSHTETKSSVQDSNENQMPTPTTLLSAFELSSDESPVANPRVPTFPTSLPSIAPLRGEQSFPQNMPLNENQFSDFLRSVLTSNDAGSLSPAHWDFEPRNVLDFTVENDLSFDATDFGLLDAFNGKPYNLNEDFAAPESTSAASQPDIKQTLGASLDERGRVALGTEAFHRSSLVRWQPQHEGSHIEMGKISVPKTDATSPDGRYRSEQHVLSEHLDQSARDQLLAAILNACDTASIGRVVSSFPTTELLDDFLQCFFTSYSTRADSYIHAPTFSPKAATPNLLGSLVASGALFTEIRALQKLGHAIQEAVRIAVIHEIENRNALTRELWLLQSFMLMLQNFLWAGNRRKMEVAESQQQPVYTMIRRAGRLKRSRMPPISPFPGDTGEVLQNKWLAWIERESFRRLAIHAFIYDAQSSMCVLVNPVISYGEVSIPLPEPRELWTAETAEQWKAVYLSLPPGFQDRQFCILDCLKDPTLLATLPHFHDTQFSTLAILHGAWGMVWEFNQLQLTTRSRTGPHNSSLVMTHRHEELCQILHQLRVNISSWPSHVQPCSEIQLLLELLMMYLHANMEDIQLFGGKEDQDEARRVFPGLQQWMNDSYARQAVWQASRVLLAARTFPRKTLRDFWAIAVYHASLVLWTYGVIRHATSISKSTPMASNFPATSIMDTNLGLSTQGIDSEVWLEGPESADVQRFIALGRGRPCISAIASSERNASSSVPELVSIEDSEAVMKVTSEVLRRNFLGDEEDDVHDTHRLGCSLGMNFGVGAGGNDAEGIVPSLVENLVQLMKDLGVAAGQVQR
ncbi:c6 zinc finger domain-containing protein [Phyllosticta citrichinensis]|uniref:C6 zinc finger domain-containing protein n=1 Tax=Phyllosticta citrichinensis TaxID=1130410 RepID=A0ABR1XNU8_9PEZI